MQEVNFVSTELKQMRREDMERFSFRSDRPCHWLQRIALFVLRKLRCFSLVTEMVSVRSHPFCPDQVTQVFAQNAELIHVYRQHGWRVLIGADELRKIVNIEMSKGPESFNGRYIFNNQLCGMKFTVIPWMKGILVIPKLED